MVLGCAARDGVVVLGDSITDGAGSTAGADHRWPDYLAQALARRGFRIVIFPGGASRAVAHMLKGYYGSLREHGSTAPWRSRAAAPAPGSAAAETIAMGRQG